MNSYLLLKLFKKTVLEEMTSLEAQWLGFSVFTAGVQAQSLVRELRSHKSSSCGGLYWVGWGGPEDA